ncbi:MAG TPA: hypothetical protein VJ992_15260 [Gemmatimonadales bacterium]|nr:hypothetical protein [Gemmatimonadales bacterium]
MARNNQMTVLVVALALAACGGPSTPAAGTPAKPLPPPPTGQTATAAAAAADTADTSANQTGLTREVFAYRGAGRDPFLSLLRSGDVRPLPGDVRVVGIAYDARYPQRSVATIRDTTSGKRYVVHVSDTIGRMRIREIRQSAVVAQLEEFGVERQIVLPLRRRLEDTQ